MDAAPLVTEAEQLRLLTLMLADDWVNNDRTHYAEISALLALLVVANPIGRVGARDAASDLKRLQMLLGTDWARNDRRHYAEIAALLASLDTQGGVAGYQSSAVHFDGDALLSIASLTATNNAFCSIAFWFKCTFAQSTGRSHWMTDPDTNANNVSFSYNVGGNRGWSVQFNNTSTGNLVVSTDTGLADGVWYCVVASFDTNHTAGSRKFKVYVNDVDMTTLDTDAGPAFTMLFNALGMTVGGDGGSGYIGDMAEFRFMPGVSLLDGGGDIPLATRRLFRDADGKPVDPATATATLGEPCILFSGDTTGFGTNQGTGGAFTLTGTLTDATTSPSD